MVGTRLEPLLKSSFIALLGMQLGDAEDDELRVSPQYSVFSHNQFCGLLLPIRDEPGKHAKM